MIDKVGLNTATVVQSGITGPLESNGNGFAEELSKQIDDQQKNGCCGGNSQDTNNVASVEPSIK